MASTSHDTFPRAPSRAAEGTPGWWTEQHTSSWERVREAFRRDWEQTKADFTAKSGLDLNQGLTDTIKQAAGSAPVPPLDVKTHADTFTELDQKVDKAREKAAEATLKASHDIAKANDKVADERSKLNDKILEAEKDLREDQKRASDKIAAAQDKAIDAIEKAESKRAEARGEIYKDPKGARDDIDKANLAIAESKAKLQDKVSDVRQELSNKEREAHGKILDARDAAKENIGKQQEKIGEAVASREQALFDWKASEPGARYGFAARSQYGSDHEWTPQLETRLSREWDSLNTGRSWSDSKYAVRRGWEYGAPKKG